MIKEKYQYYCDNDNNQSTYAQIEEHNKFLNIDVYEENHEGWSCINLYFDINTAKSFIKEFTERLTELEQKAGNGGSK